ncbi:MAG: type III PLP-dependent enzyme [Nanoarchaeota archaeon]
MNKDKLEKLEKIAQKEGTPILVMDHSQIRKNYQTFKEKLPRVQIYYAVKANSEKEIIKTLFKEGASFDVASLPEFTAVLDFVKDLPLQEFDDFIWDNIIYANPVKKVDSLKILHRHKPLLTYDCIEEMEKIKEYCPEAGVLLRIKVPNEGSQVKFNHKFGLDYELAPDLIEKTIKAGIGVEGISFHAGSQCNNPLNFVKALEYASYVFNETDKRELKVGESVTKGYPIKILDLGGGFPVKYNGDDQSFGGLAKIINKELDRLFPIDKVDVLAEPGRFLVANAGIAIFNIILAKHSLNPPCYHIDDGTYGLLSAIVADHLKIKMEAFREGEKSECYVFGQTCDGWDIISENPDIPNNSKIFLPKLKTGDLVYVENMGAYTNASASRFNGYELPKVVHVNVK